MTLVAANISVSVDGYAAGPDDSDEHPLGVGGERLHEWLYGLSSWRERHGREGGEASPDADVIDEAFGSTGAYVMGRRMFDLGLPNWGEEPPFHAPIFVLTHRARDPLPLAGGTTFTFVTSGIAEAIGAARAAAGEHDVTIAGGARVVQEALGAGLLDELQIHVVPVLLGGGVRLFAENGGGARPVGLEQVRVVATPAVTHLKYRVVR